MRLTMQGPGSHNTLFLVYLPRALTAALLVLLCWMLAQWTWLLATPTPPVAHLSPAPVIDPQAARDRMARAALFESNASLPKRDVTARTTLNVKLVGVLESSPGRSPSLAILSLNGKANEIYAEGREISPGIVLHRISRDHAVIRNQGAFERVDFPDRAAAGNNAGGFNLNVAQQAPGQFSFSRDTLNRALQDPAQLAQLGTLTVVPGAGAAIGQVPAGSLMEKLGLQPGDMIKVVNGEAVDSPDDLPRLYQKFAATGRVTLEGSRAGAPLKLTYTVKP